jgi:D-xylose transport system permease protein
MVVAVAVFAAVHAALALSGANGLTAPPLGVTLLTIAVAAIGGIVLVLICNANRALALTPRRAVGVPFVLSCWAGLLVAAGRTRLGRYIYAIGANPEAARRAGINVARIARSGS